MVRRSFTAVLEKNSAFNTSFETEPYEAGWASESRWFVRIMEMSGDGASIALYPQISPDGLFWCDEGTPPMTIKASELESAGTLYSCALGEFGQWLRLRAVLQGDRPSVKVLIYLSLKE